MRIVISMGDPAGVGPEVIVKALSRTEFSGVSFMIIGEEYYLEKAQEITGCKFAYKCVSEPDFSEHIVVYQPEEWGEEYAEWGRWSLLTGEHSLNYVATGVKMCLEGQADALVTAPICKSAWKAAGCEFPGHTELIGEMCGVHDEVMMLVGGGLRVALVTTHVSISDLPDLITVERVKKVLEKIDKDMKVRFSLASPRIAVLGLNPHAGENGHLGREEIEVINPAVASACAAGINAFGAIPADTAFHRMLNGAFDVILAMYHDQGLGPLKTVAFDSGVNVTLGLPVIRTSVDHGTAFDIAGSGIASEVSMEMAISTAVEMAVNEKKFLAAADF